MRGIAVSLCLMMVAMSFAGCVADEGSNDDGNGGATDSPSPTTTTLGFPSYFVQSLPACDTSYEGALVFDNSTKAMMTCESGTWNDVTVTIAVALMDSVNTDTDGDGVLDLEDQCPNTTAGDSADSIGCSAAQKDSDNDGVSDAGDVCPGTTADKAASVDANGCTGDEASYWNYIVADVKGNALTDRTDDALIALTWVNGASPASPGAPWSNIQIILIDAQQNELECEEDTGKRNYDVADGTSSPGYSDFNCLVIQKTTNDDYWSPEETIWIEENGMDVGGCEGDNSGQNCAVRVKVIHVSSSGQVIVVGGGSKEVTISPN